MSKFRKTLKSNYYWNTKGQGKIYNMLSSQIEKRGDAARLARKIGSTPGYISQILNGDSELNPTWNKIVKFCLALDKVPVLEIKDIDEYINEQKLIASYSKLENMFDASCVDSIDTVKEIDSPEHIELNDYTFLFTSIDKNKKKEVLFKDDYLDEYELI